MRSVYTQDTRVTEHAHTANDETLWQEESVYYCLSLNIRLCRKSTVTPYIFFS